MSTEDTEAPETPVEATEEPKDTETAPKAVEEPAEAPESTEEEEGDSPDEPVESFSHERDSAVNSELMAKEEAEGKDGEEEDALPSFFVAGGDDEERERVRVEMDILTSKKNGKVLTVARSGLDIDYKELDYLTHTAAWFEFTMPGYEEISKYRGGCGVWQPQAQQVLIDKLKMRDFLLVWHLKDWSLTGKDGKVVLSHDEDGSLSKESVKKVYSLHTTIIDIVMTIFEKDALLT